MAPAVRQAHHPGPHVVGDRHPHLAAMHAALEDRELAVAHLVARGVVGMHVEHAALAARHQRRQVVHPGVVAPQLAATDQDEAVFPGLRLDVALERGDRLQHARRRQMDVLVPVKQALLYPGSERTQIDAVGRSLQLLETETVRPREEAIPVGAEPQDQIQEPRRRPAHAEGTEPAERPVDPRLAERATAQALRQLEHDLPVGELAFISLDDRGRPARDVPHGNRVEQQIDVVLGQIPAGRQDHVGVARRLVDVDVDRHHELELLERRADSLPVGCREDGVAGQRDHGADLARARGLDLVRQHGRREIAERLRQPAHPALPAVMAVEAAHARDAADVERGRREHRSAFSTEPSGGDVQQVGGVRRRRRVAADADADARVAHGRARVGELERQALDGLGRHAGERGNARRRERGQAPLDLGPSAGPRLQEPPVDAAALDQDANHRQQKRRIAARPDRDVLVRLLRGLRAARVDHHDLATALAHRAQATAHVGRGHDAPVRDHRVAAEAEEVVGAIDVGDRNRDRRAVQLVGGHDARVGVLRARAEAVTGADRLRERAQHQERPVVVPRGVAPVEADRVAAVPLADLADAASHEVECLVPGDLLEVACRVPAHRSA